MLGDLPEGGVPSVAGFGERTLTEIPDRSIEAVEDGPTT